VQTAFLGRLPAKAWLALTGLLLAAEPGPEQIAAARRWEPDLAALEARDRAESHPPDSILLVGSSSIRLWDSIVADLAPYHPIPRGFGGARFADVAVHARRLIRPHRFRALVLFAANDVTGAPDDARPEQVAAWFGHLVEVARAAQPEAPIFCLEITPTPARWAAWPKIQEVNRALARECARRPGVHFIPTAHAFLTPEGRPAADLFRDDRLHLNALGYRLWSAILKSHLDARLGIGKEAAAAEQPGVGADSR
jgi:hypothetical protein